MKNPVAQGDSSSPAAFLTESMHLDFEREAE
jgi:hypothetical protein